MWLLSLIYLAVMRASGCGSMVCCGNLEVGRIRTGLGRGGPAGCKSGGDDLHSLWKCSEKRRWGRAGGGGLLNCTLANIKVQLAMCCTDSKEFRELGNS